MQRFNLLHNLVVISACGPFFAFRRGAEFSCISIPAMVRSIGPPRLFAAHGEVVA
jgi:hypothetical protein